MPLCLALANPPLFRDQSHVIYFSLHLEEYAVTHPDIVLRTEDAEVSKMNKDCSPKHPLLLLGIQTNLKCGFK